MKLGKFLLEENLVTQEQLDKALKDQEVHGGRLGTNLMKLGYITEKQLISILSKQYNVPGVDLSTMDIEDGVLKLIPSNIATKYELIPLSRIGKTLTVAMVNPDDIFALEDIKFSTGFEVQPVVTTEISIRNALEKFYEGQDLLQSVEKEMEAVEEEVEVVEAGDKEADEDEMSDLAAEIGSGPIVKLVNTIITKGVEAGASDIHIEPYDKELRVRFRIDGILREVMKPPKKMHKAVVSRIKIMAKMKIAEKRLPQDGRIKVRIKRKPIDFRVASMPTIYGEKMALRILDRSAISFNLEDLGFEKEQLEKFLQAIRMPFGIVLVTGPTGCGKTTTLYSALEKINSLEVNITTAEDPVEYTLVGVNQVQMREMVGLTFASALRSYLRQDPNIIMVGEIRDKETAEISIRASLTGHLVLSTVHTNTAAATITRLVNMGVQPFLLASTLNLVLSERLLRKICLNCMEKVQISNDYLKRVGLNPDEFDGVTFHKGAGCPVCNGSGYKGRIGIFEVMTLTPGVRELILERVSTDRIHVEAVKEGMRTLRDVAVEKLKKGSITIEEVLKETTIK
ncbi:type IV-A pilus assembly ATPase PilB [candidate division WOR-3 bacterium]|nr:type IV-A pilus assembly ATPase PilB [candidate division WOR-3 bacterium]